MSKGVFKFDLGDVVQDVVSSYEGVVMARHEYLTGCVQYTVQKQGTDKDGKVFESYYFDESRLKITKKKSVAPVVQAAAAASPGGPQSRPARRSPRRA